ncbi:LPXTG cell wall anchor domain-containing protein [Macrococcoides caseolyticum]|uniref:LPXTG cell wall anchor domain-containing protein n=1 Tax=Macrococcoides caseolyticum TaxID=69966 RepID=UPI0012FF1A3E|nr:LPXTG cell wall anchor domain-containing protein [Macrococcus caseolyticus]
MKKTTKTLGTATLATAVLFSTIGNVSYAAEKPNSANGKSPYLSDTVLTDIDGDLLGTVVDGTEGYGDFEPDVVGGINPELDLNGNGILDFEEEEEAEPNPIEISPDEDDEPVVIDYGLEDTQGSTSTPSVETTTETPSVETTEPSVEKAIEPKVETTTKEPTAEETTKEPSVKETTKEPSVKETTKKPKQELSLDTVKLTKDKPYIDVPGTYETAIVSQRRLPLVYEVGSPVSNLETLKYGMWVQGDGAEDLQHTLKVETNIDFNKPGEYVVKYTAGKKGKEYVMYVLAIVEGKAPNKEGVKAPNKNGVKAPNKEGVKAQTKVVNNAVNGDVVPNTLGANTNAVGGKAPTTVDNTTTIENVDVNKGLGSTLNKSESLEGSAVDKVKVGNEVKASEKQLPDTGETSTNTGIIAGLLMSMGLGFLVKRKKSVNQ